MDSFHIQQALQSELLSGETLLWAGQPCRRVFFHKDDTRLIPFSLMWGGFAIFWEYMATTGFRNGSSGNWFMALWGVPFVVIGQYMIWGRFLYMWWKKGRVFYGVTSKRVIVLDQSWSRETNAVYIDQIPTIQKDCRSDGIGTLRFGYPPPQTNRSRSFYSFDSFSTGGVPSFIDVANAESVYSLVTQAREKLASSRDLNITQPQ